MPTPASRARPSHRSPRPAASRATAATLVLRPDGLGFDPDEAARALARADARLAPLVARVGPPRITIDQVGSTFEALAEAVVYQQLTGKAAATIFARVRAHVAGDERGALRPEAVLAASDHGLRGAGLSRAKVLALRDLATRTRAGEIPTAAALARLSDDDVIARLVPVRGVGRWTAEMFLIFRLGRADVLPVSDYGVRKGFGRVFLRGEPGSPAAITARGERWKPFRTAAAWYLWRAAEGK
jgi:3-methyladenine DNA glycosylase/8-oxoguanine DNA glycosylase